MRNSFQWFIPIALAALARNIKSPGRVINAMQLSAWVEDEQLDFPQGISEMALAKLQLLGYMHAPSARRNMRGILNSWVLTPAGLQAAVAALHAMPGASGPDLDALSTRVWNLLRIRRRLTADEAAQTLVDVGSNFAAQKKRIGAMLSAWTRARPSVITMAQKREAGSVRYVLLNDIGRWPPPQHPDQLHPTDFVIQIPARYRKAALSVEGFAQ